MWAAEPNNDSTENTVDYLIQHAEHQLETANIACRNRTSLPLPRMELSPEIRQTVFLTFKEALNNILKHAQAKEVWLTVIPEGECIMIRVADDGVGFDPKADTGGNHNGLRNMAERMAGIGGSFAIRSEPGKGTKVEIIFAITQKGDTSFITK